MPTRASRIPFPFHVEPETQYHSAGYAADASDLGLAPGYFPDEIVVQYEVNTQPLRNVAGEVCEPRWDATTATYRRHDTYRSRNGDVSYVHYTLASLAGPVDHLIVYND